MALKLKNARDWKTTVITVVGVLLVVAGAVWPEKVDAETQETIKSALNEVLLSVGILINTIIGIFATTDS
jgi:hypothetical protein